MVTHEHNVNGIPPKIPHFFNTKSYSDPKTNSNSLFLYDIEPLATFIHSCKAEKEDLQRLRGLKG